MIHIVVQKRLTQHCKTIILQLKKKKAIKQKSTRCLLRTARQIFIRLLQLGRDASINRAQLQLRWRMSHKWGIGKMENTEGRWVESYLYCIAMWIEKTHFAVWQHGIILSTGSEWGLRSTLGTQPKTGRSQGSVWLSILAQRSGKCFVPCQRSQFSEPHSHS